MANRLALSLVCIAAIALSPRVAAAQSTCETQDTSVMVLEVPACWSPEQSAALHRGMRTELSAHGVTEIANAPTASDWQLRIRDTCDEPSNAVDIRLEFMGRAIEEEILVGDVESSDLPRVLALAAAELFAKRCQFAVKPPEPESTLVANNKPAKPVVVKPAGPTTSPWHASLIAALRVSGGVETVGYYAPQTCFRGASLAINYVRDALEFEVGVAIGSIAVEDDLGRIDVRNTVARFGVSHALYQRNRWALGAAVNAEVGWTNAEGVPAAAGTFSESIKGLNWAVRTGPYARLALTPTFSAEVYLGGGLGGGVPITAAGERIVATAGGSLRASARVRVRF